MALKVDVSAGQMIGFSGSGDISITLLAKSGQKARLSINADKSVKIELPKESIGTSGIVSRGLSRK